MKYPQKINYRIFTAGKNEFPAMVDTLLGCLPEDEVILRLVFFGMPPDNKEYLKRRTILREKISLRFRNSQPALSYVAQPPLNGALTVEIHSYRPDEEDCIEFNRIEDFPYVLLRSHTGRFLFAGGLQGNILNETLANQSQQVFEIVKALLEKEKFPVNSIIRQWNYIEKITGFENENQNYQSFNNARSEFYAAADWSNGYPAATGIGADPGGILIDFDAAIFTSPDTYATPINNKLQIAAHNYSGNVLAAAQSKKLTPKFERAKSMAFGDKKLVYISGTAAIRGEQSLHGVGLEQQLHITVENIAQLTGDAKPVMLRVYLKESTDYEEAERLMKTYYPDIPISYMCADVCRDELLIEIEGIAVTQ
ncbi:MAG: endoribonuclease L-PSP [Tannerellaceae bacterium]|nr:endoribonuclease L-PSP [Tannerellaceae bacterium]